MLPKKKSKPSPAACLSCRDRHLKCDGQTPVCIRCADAGASCVFVQSRRGRRGGRAMHHLDTQPVLRSSDPPPLRLQAEFPPTVPLVSQDEPLPQSISLSEETVSMALADVGTSDEEYLISLYYQYIHPAHPFVLPQKLYARNRGLFPIHLRKAMCFIASHHSPGCADQYHDVSSIVSDRGLPEDVFKVQSLILITLASYARFERDKGNNALNAAINVATRIGLASDDFGDDHELLFRESWRRTWWELYTITGLISLIAGTNLRLSQPACMTLPYDCETYDAGQIANMGNVEQMQQRFHSESMIRWSSFAYRVEAMRILAVVLGISNDVTSSRCDAASASISSYLLSLPDDKREGLKTNGEVDEVMSCALMIIHLAGICLNYPRSVLAHNGNFKTVCGNDRGKATSGTEKSHQAAALRSAKGLAKLISLHTTLRTLSPCFSCAIAFSAVVHLSEYSMQMAPRAEYLQENLQLQLSALHSLGDIWPIARVVRSQIAQFAREAFGRIPPQVFPEPLPVLDQSTLDDQWLQDLVNEEIGSEEASMPFLGGSHLM